MITDPTMRGIAAGAGGEMAPQGRTPAPGKPDGAGMLAADTGAQLAYIAGAALGEARDQLLARYADVGELASELGELRAALPGHRMSGGSEMAELLAQARASTMAAVTLLLLAMGAAPEPGGWTDAGDGPGGGTDGPGRGPVSGPVRRGHCRGRGGRRFIAYRAERRSRGPPWGD